MWLRTAKEISRHRVGNDHTGGHGETLQKTESKQRPNLRRRRTSETRDRQEQQSGEERAFATPGIRQHAERNER